MKSAIKHQDAGNLAHHKPTVKVHFVTFTAQNEWLA